MRSTEGIDVVPLDPQQLNQFLAAPKRLFRFDPSHVWERYGEMNEYPDVSWIEGPWMLRSRQPGSGPRRREAAHSHPSAQRVCSVPSSVIACPARVSNGTVFSP
jgi:hypothetical protein